MNTISRRLADETAVGGTNAVHAAGLDAPDGSSASRAGGVAAVETALDDANAARRLPRAELDADAGDTDRGSLVGPDVALMPEAYTSLTRVVHEMSTKAVKCGSLSDDGGRLDVRWAQDDTGSLVIDWKKVGGPAVLAPERRGFGSAPIERAVPFELGGGEATDEFNSTAVVGRSPIAGHHVREPAAAHATAAAPKERSRLVPADLAVLLVEDNLIIAMDAEAMLQELGFAEVKVAASVGDALRLLDTGPVGCALLDVNLGQETSLPVAETLMARNIPFVFASGYCDAELLPEQFRHIAVVTKPYGEKRVREALSEAIGRTA